MKQHPKMRIIATVSSCIAAALFLLFYIYLALFENVDVYSSRHAHNYDMLTDYNVEHVDDASAPVGTKTLYHFTVENHDSSESCMCFYVSHHYVEIYIDGELIYELDSSENNHISNTIGSSWVTIPIHENDSGKEMTIVLTPLFKNVIHFEPEFLAGSHYSIVVDQLKSDMPQLFLSLLCIILGFLMMAMQLYFMAQTNTKKWDMFYLAIFAILLGLWRITDTPSSPILFSNNPLVLGYITIGSLFLCGLFLQLYISTFFTKKRAYQSLGITMGCIALTFVILFMQIFGIAEFKQTLPISHFMLIVAIICVIIFTFLSERDGAPKNVLKNRSLFLILAIGISLDIAVFYIHNSSSYVVCSLIAFVIYTLIVFVTNTLDTTKKAQLDSPTGLINKSRWNELTSQIHLEDEPVGITMIDLNDLKKVNDTHGHEIGDRMIFDFAKILKNAFPSNSVICRWGGDEFVVMNQNKTKEDITGYINTMQTAVTVYNQKNPSLPLSCAVGFCISDEHPEATIKDLLEIADNRMYKEKALQKKWTS